MTKSFQEIRQRFPEKFLLLENYQERDISPTEVEVIGAELVNAYDSLSEVMTAYRLRKREGRHVVFCTPRYTNSFVFERQPSARILG